MDNLLESIEQVRFSNQNPADGNHYVPDASLFEILTEPAIRLCLEELEVPLDERIPLTSDIVNGARKCFSILLLIRRGKSISGFFRHDSMQRSRPDDRLPYTKDALQKILEVDESHIVIMQFLEKQWDFTVPTITQTLTFREFDPRIRLPFTEETPAGEGSMGIAYKVHLHPQCHDLKLTNHMVVRKELKRGKSEDAFAFRKELENLSLLAYLHHPNIVQLYCSYIHRGHCSLIFGAADGGSLADLLKGKPNVPQLEVSQVLLGLADLASAIDSLHNFTYDSLNGLNLQLTGCHHDLAPRNILIKDGTFLLIDFGLSTLRNPDEDSLTTFKEVRGSYIAPECQIPIEGHELRSEKINRASDVWSFGCILSEILIHIMLGPAGVEDFRKQRLVSVTSDIEWYRFHLGPGRPNPAVDTMLKKLQEGNEPYAVQMVDLIRWMLSMDPSHRPKSTQTLMALRGISILHLSTSVETAWRELCDKDPSADHVLGQFTFAGWLFAIKRLLAQTIRKEVDNIGFNFPDGIVQGLKASLQLLSASAAETSGANHQRQPLLRKQNRDLLNYLPPFYRAIAERNLIDQISDDDNITQILPRPLIDQTINSDIGILIATRRLVALDEKGSLISNRDITLNQRDITVVKDICLHSLAKLDPGSEPIFVEWLKYREPMIDEAHGKELRNRMEAIATLLNASQIPGTLRCRGIFHEVSRRSFGFAYTFPMAAAKPYTLFDLLSMKDKKTRDKRFRPLLELRFKLAFDVCECIQTLHEVGWLHRNVHSMNILFLPPEGARDFQIAQKPWMLGLGASRENRTGTFTQGHDEVGQLRNYHHPAFLSGERYREQFDYYSVGMVLLEIGLWDTLSELTSSNRFKGLTDDQFKKEVVSTRIPKLGIAMGSVYMKATQWCLDRAGGMEQGEEVDIDRDGPCLEFKRNVVDRIARLPEC